MEAPSIPMCQKKRLLVQQQPQNIPQKGHKVVMKNRDLLVDILIALCPGVYDNYVVSKKGHK
eukprot:9800639-Ditylum_brightwellii.AAC.1